MALDKPNLGRFSLPFLINLLCIVSFLDFASCILGGSQKPDLVITSSISAVQRGLSDGKHVSALVYLKEVFFLTREGFTTSQTPIPKTPFKGPRFPLQNLLGFGKENLAGKTPSLSFTSLPRAAELPCPEAHLTTYATPTGVFFWIECEVRRSGGKKFQVGKKESFQDCIDSCGEKINCRRVTYRLGECSLFDGTDLDTCDTSPGYKHAYEIPPPGTSRGDPFSGDDGLLACSASCPTGKISLSPAIKRTENVKGCAGNGQSYISKFGRTFHINCDRRHGTRALRVEAQETLQDCIDACSSFIACHSVDYQVYRKSCSFLSHQGEPTLPQLGFGSAYSAPPCNRQSNLYCNNKPSEPDITCDNQGFQYAIYPNLKADGTPNQVGDPTYSSFDPTLFKTAAYEFSGATKSIGFSNSNLIYSNTPSDPGFVTVNHRGYLFAKEAGKYTFSAVSTDDVTFLWVGPKAFSGYNRENTDLFQRHRQPPVSYSATLLQGQYVPIRIIYANGGGPGAFSIEIKAPDNSIIIGNDTNVESLFLVRYSCDKTSAPRFPHFGSET